MILPLAPEVHTKRVPFATLGIVVACTLIFVVQWILYMQVEPSRQFSGIYHALADGYTLKTYRIFSVSPFSLEGWKQYFTLISSGFLHGGWMHLSFNMLFLLCFGRRIEDRLGHGRFLAFYFSALILQGLLMSLWHLAIGRHANVIGASGAVSALMGAYLVKFPHERITTFVWLIIRIWFLRISAGWLLGYWFAVELFQLWLDPRMLHSSVAFSAHVAGFVAGILMIWAFTGWRVESRANEHKRRWSDLFRAFKSIAKSELRLIGIIFVLAPVVLFAMAYLSTYFIQVPEYWRFADGGMRERTRMELAWIAMTLNSGMLLLFFFVMLGAFVWWRKRQQLRAAMLEKESCILCHSSELSQNADTETYQCRQCGFSSENLQEPPYSERFQVLQDARLSLGFLQDANVLVEQDEAQSALVSFDEEHIKNTFEAFSEAYSVFKDFLQRHEPFLRDWSREAQPTEQEAAEALLQQFLTGSSQISADSDGTGGFLREKRNLLKEALDFLLEFEKRLTKQLSELLCTAQTPQPTEETT